MADLAKKLAESTNYVVNDEQRPTWVAFANKRTVTIKDGYLQIGWIRDIEDESIAGPAIWRMRMALQGGLAQTEIASLRERIRRLEAAGKALDKAIGGHDAEILEAVAAWRAALLPPPAAKERQ